MEASVAPVTVTPEQTVKLCKKAQGAKTCRFLTIGGPEMDFQCAKGSEMHDYLNRRALEGNLKAQGDNCTGPPDFKPLE